MIHRSLQTSRNERRYITLYRNVSGSFYPNRLVGGEFETSLFVLARHTSPRNNSGRVSYFRVIVLLDEYLIFERLSSFNGSVKRKVRATAFNQPAKQHNEMLAH